MRIDILLDTNRFNLSETKPYFINDECFGEDFARWLRQRLRLEGVRVDDEWQEDWGWQMGAAIGTTNYLIGIGGTVDDSSNDPNQGEWRIMIEKQRSLFERVLGKNKMDNNDEMVSRVRKLTLHEDSFANLRVEAI